VRVGKLVWLRMGKVKGLIFGMIVRIRQRIPRRLRGAVLGDFPITKC